MTFYFTFGTSGHPYKGGWVEVIADHEGEALRKYRERFPDKSKGVLHCAGFYRPTEFWGLSIRKEGNLGAFCHEVIE